MSDVVSFRFREHELDHISKLSEARKTDKTSAARELIEYGWMYYVVQQYKEGKLSLERSAKELHIPLGDFIELLASLGVKSPVTYDDYLEGLRNIK